MWCVISKERRRGKNLLEITMTNPLVSRVDEWVPSVYIKLWINFNSLQDIKMVFCPGLRHDRTCLNNIHHKYLLSSIDTLSSTLLTKRFVIVILCRNFTPPGPVGWGCRIQRLLLCRGVRLPNECPGYDTKQSDCEVPAMLEIWGMRSTPSLPSLPGPLWPGVVAPDKGPIYGLHRTNGILMLNWIVWVNWIAWNRNVFDN